MSRHTTTSLRPASMRSGPLRSSSLRSASLATASARSGAFVDEMVPRRAGRAFAPPVGQVPQPGPIARVSGRTGPDADGTRVDDAGVEVVGRVSPAAFMSAAAGLVLATWAVVALVRTGAGRPLRSPIVEVGGFTTTAVLALIVLGAGAMLLLGAATRHRPTIGLVGIVVTAAAVGLAMRPNFGDGALAAERDFAIAVAILSGITAAVAVLAPNVDRRRRIDRVGPDREPMQR